MEPLHRAAAWALSSGLASAAEAAPAAGQTVAEWQNAVTANLEARGDKMGFSMEPCALKPPFAGAPLARHPPDGVWEEGEGLSKDSRNGLADTAGGRL